MRRRRIIRWTWAAAIVLLAACTSEVLGAIPPSQFQYRTVVPLRAGLIGGWRAAQVVITLGSRYGVAVCQVEVGVPLANNAGVVPEEQAQVAAARAADLAARQTLADSRATTLSATLCRAFIDEMDRILGAQIPGARASVFVTEGLVPSRWPK